MKTLFSLLLIIATHLVGELNAQQLGFNIVNNKKSVNIPFKLYNNLIVVPVIINNQLPLRFILDTGVRTTILTQKAYSDILNLKYSKVYRIAGMGEDADQGIEAYVTNNVSLTLPGVVGKGHAMLVLKEDYLELRNYLGFDVHGVLGYEVFSRFIVTIDYDNKMLTLTTPEHFKPKRRHTKVAVEIEDTKPFIKAKITQINNSETEVKLMVDTGASHGLMLLTDSTKEIAVPEKNLQCNLGRGLEGNIYGKIGRIKSFYIEDMGWEQPLATFPEKEGFLETFQHSNVRRNGSIGGEILSRFKVIFNFSDGAMYLKKGNSYRQDFTYNMSGLTIIAKGSKLSTYVITEVRKDSPAEESGVKVGDHILSVNGIAVNRLTLENINGYLSLRENKKIKLVLEREAEIINTKFRLRSEI